MDLHILGILQASLASSPPRGKALLDLAGASMLARIVERLSKVSLMSDLVVATSFEEVDQAVFLECARLNVKAIAGPKDDLLERFYRIARSYSPHAIVRFKADCPLVDPEWCDLIIKELLSGYHDYVGVSDLPAGVAAECFTFEALEQCRTRARSAPHKRRVTSLFLEKASRFDIRMLQAPSYQRAAWLNLSVGSQDDYLRMRKIYEDFYEPGRIVSVSEVIDVFAANQPNEPPVSLDGTAAHCEPLPL